MPTLTRGDAESLGQVLDNLGSTSALITSVGVTHPGAEVSVRAASISGLLADRGVQVGSPVAISGQPGVAMATALLGVARSHVAVPVSALLPLGRLTALLKGAGVTAVVAGSQAVALRQCGRNLGLPVIDLPEALEEWPGSHGQLEATADAASPAFLLQTSGSTGSPKLVTITHGSLLSSARSVIDALELTSGDRSLAVMPLFHIHGLAVTLTGTPALRWLGGLRRRAG